MNFKSSAKCFTAILVPEVFLEIFLRERASELATSLTTSCEAQRRERVFFSLSSQFRNGDLFISGNRRFEHQFSFGKSVGALRTNFHRRHECTATTDLSFVARRTILHTYIHTFIDHFPKGAFQCQLQRKG